MGTKVMKVWEHENLFDAHTGIDADFDENSGEYYKIVPDTTTNTTGVQATIDSAITHLEHLKGSLDCFNEKGLKIVENNISDAIDRIRYAAIDLEKE